MTDNFTGFKNAIIIDERVDIRTTVRDAIKELGVAKTTSASSIQEGWSVIETSPEPPDWIVTCISPEANINAFHLLTLVLNEPSLINTRISFIASPTQAQYFAPAFELGLLSFHLTPFTKSSLMSQFASMFKSLSKKRNEHCLTAAEFLREYLADSESFGSLINLEESLARRFPDRPFLFLKLAEAQMFDGQNAKAAITLQQAKHLGADLSTGVKQLQDLISSEGPKSDGDEDGGFIKAFNLSSAMIVESDEATTNQVSTLLQGIGIDDIQLFTDGESAANWIDSHEMPPIIIQSWKLPKLSGAALLQRIAQKGAGATTLVIMGSSLQQDDHALLKEMGASMVTHKPIDNDGFLRSLMSALREDRFPNSAASIERKIRHLIKAGDAKGAEVQFATLHGVASVNKATLLGIGAEIAYLKMDYELTKSLALDAIREKADAGAILDLLGKTYLKLGDKEAAFKCLNRSQQFSSKNLERLCLLAEVSADLGNKGEANEALEKARAVDKNSESVKVTEAGIALVSGDAQRAKSVMRSLESLSGVISHMNNRAITLSQSGKVKESIELYQTALASLPDSNRAEKGALNYNIGLAYIRMEAPDEALKALEKIVAADNPALHQKAASLISRIKAAKASGTKVVLKENAKLPTKPTEAPKSARPIALHTMPGEICLHLLYNSGDMFTPEIIQWTAKTPNYKRQPK